MKLGQLGYLQIPARDLAASAAFYTGVLGWSVDASGGGFEAPGLIGQLTTDLAVAPDGGPVGWFCVGSLYRALSQVEACGGRVRTAPWLDGGERWLAEAADPAGNRLGLVAPVRAPQPQPLLAVRDVEASSRWYQHVLGLRSDHGGPEYERLLAGGTLVLQLHQESVEHHHGAIGPAGSGALVWFGEVPDFDDVVARAAEVGAEVVRDVHRNPPEGRGNGPGHREVWLRDPDGYTVVVASPDGEAWEPAP
jgi:predicted enzyme related to lactoylglutathione lyase